MVSRGRQLVRRLLFRCHVLSFLEICMQSVVCIKRASRLRACKVAPPSRPTFAGTTPSRRTCPTFPVRHGALILGGYLLPRVVPRKAHRSPLRGRRKERTSHGLTAPVRWIGRKNKVAVVVTGTQKIDGNAATFDPGTAKPIGVLYLAWIARRSFIRQDIGFIRPSLSRADVLAAACPLNPGRAGQSSMCPCFIR